MEIKHDSQRQKFFVIVDGLESHLEYISKGSILNLIHTYVPNELRGRGIAGNLVKAALTYARENKFKIIPSCSYTAEYIRKHEEFHDLIV